MSKNTSASIPKFDPYKDYISPESILEWMDDNVREIIHRNTFTTVTIDTLFGPRSFRISGPDSLYRAIIKAKEYKDQI